MISIRYIGHRATYRESCYGSGLLFTQGEALPVDQALAKKLLRHPDVYALDASVEGDSSLDSGSVSTDATSAQTNPPEDSEEDQAQDMRDAIMGMNKSALQTYAKTHFSVDLDASQKVGELRARVVGLFDQFGVE